MEAPRTPAQWYSLLIGAALAAGGVLALLTGSTNFGSVSSGAGQEFIIWQVSGWETILYMATGALGILAASRVDAARTFALSVGVVYAAIAVWGFIDGNSVASIFAVDTTDNITYAAVGGLGLALAAMPESVQRTAGVGRDPHAQH